MVFCSECGNLINNPTDKFCENCGASQEVIASCVNCAAAFTNADDLFCGECGTRRMDIVHHQNNVQVASPPVTKEVESTFPSSTSIAYSSNISIPSSQNATESSSFSDHEDLFGVPISTLSTALDSISTTTSSSEKTNSDQRSLNDLCGSESNTTSMQSSTKGYLSSTMESYQKLIQKEKTKVEIPEEKHGDGLDVTIHDVAEVQEKSSKAYRKMISNSTISTELNGYRVFKISSGITALRKDNPQFGSLQQYKNRLLSDDDSWQRILHQHRDNKTQFVDESFPPDSSSLFHDVNNKKHPHLSDLVSNWKRISDFFTQTAYIQVNIYDDEKKLVCGIAQRTVEEYAMAPSAQEDYRFILIAQEAVNTGISGKIREHCLLMTKSMIEWTTQIGVEGQNFEVLWKKRLLEGFKPLKFSGLGNSKAWRMSNDGHVAKVCVIIPLFFQASEVRLFERNIRDQPLVKPGKVKQGRLADCYFLGALTSLSTSQVRLGELFPEIDESLYDSKQDDCPVNEQQYNEEGVYAVRFWREGRSHIVVVDDYIPCSPYGKPAFANFTAEGFEIWPMIVEKAYAKLNGSYESLIGGQEAFALEDITGGIPLQIRISGEKGDVKYTNEEGRKVLWDLIKTSLRNGSILTSIIDDNRSVENCILPAHAYGIQRVAEVTVKGNRSRLVQIRNGWVEGGEWQGQWNRDDPSWKWMSKEQKKQLNFNYAEDGTWWMEYMDYCNLFSSMVILRDFFLKEYQDEMWTSYIIHGEFDAQSCGGREALHINPQYHLLVPETMKVIIQLEQPSRRPQCNENYSIYIAPILCQNAKLHERKIDLTHDVIATGTFLSSRSCLLEIELQGSEYPYAIIPATYDRDQLTSFVLRVSTSKKSSLYPVDQENLPKCNMCQRILQGSFRTFGSERICLNCVDEYRSKNTMYCSHCKHAIVKQDSFNGTSYSGNFFTLEDGTSCHSECIDEYRKTIAQRCVECGLPVCKIEGQFDGRFFVVENQQHCHQECIDVYRLRKAEKCDHCAQGILQIVGQFSGKFYKTETNQKVHFECWEAYQMEKAEKCSHCFGPILKLEGKYDGRFYELAGGNQKVHFECWNAHQNADNIH